jgi:hypothetical protein
MQMQGHRYVICAIVALASASLVVGMDMYALDEGGQSTQFVGKSPDELSKSVIRGRHGERGWRGHHGSRGKRGEIGLTGNMGPPGATGAAGPAGTSITPCIGSACGSDSVSITLTAQNINSSPTLQLAPLYLGTPASQASAVAQGSPFYFTPYVAGTAPTGASYTILSTGSYRLYYGLVGVPNAWLYNGLVNTLTGAPQGACWICIQIDHGGTGTLTQIGAVPLAATWTSNVMPDPTQTNLWNFTNLLVGFGQVWTQLQQNDVVTLQIMLATPPPNPTTSIPQLYIGPNNITYPSKTAPPIPAGGMSIARGPTLTIIKTAD